MGISEGRGVRLCQIADSVLGIARALDDIRMELSRISAHWGNALVLSARAWQASAALAAPVAALRALAAALCPRIDGTSRG
jgi:hypothetical protein